MFRNPSLISTLSLYYQSLHVLNSHLNFSEAQKPAPHSGLGPARPAEHPVDPEEADEGEATLPVDRTPPVHTDERPQTSGGLPGLGIDMLPADIIDEGNILYKLDKPENKYTHSLNVVYFLLVNS